jgi:TolB-like protein
MTRWLLVLVLALAGVGVTARADAQDLATALRTLAAQLDRVAELRGKNVGVAAFPTPGGRLTELGAFVADQLDEAMIGRAATAGFSVVSRAQLCQVIREYKLWLDDRFDPAASKKIGNLSPADFLLSGQLTPLGRTATLSVKLVDTKTGRLLWGNSATFGVNEDIKRLIDSSGSGSDRCAGDAAPTTVPTPPPVATPDPMRLAVQVSAEKSRYRIGEAVRFRLKVNRDAYVTLVDVGTSGDVTVLFPNRFHPNHFVRGGEEVLIPPQDAGFRLTVQGPPGTDHVRAIATVEPVRFLLGDFAAQGTVFRSLDRVQTRSMTVEMTKELDKVAPDQRADHVIAVEIRP